MFWSRKKKLNDYEKAIKEFNFDMSDIRTNEQYNNINKAYRDIKVYYEEKNKNEQFDIKIEKIRIERNLGIQPNDIIWLGLAYYIAIMGSVFYFMFQLIISFFDKYINAIKVGAILAFLLTMTLSAAYIIGKDIMKGKPRNLMLNISLKVLEDIEKEIAEAEARKKEEVEKLEIKLRNEQYFNAQNEVAATSDRIIDNTKNDKNSKGNGKSINGFINIIINKIYSK